MVTDERVLLQISLPKEIVKRIDIFKIEKEMTRSEALEELLKILFKIN